MQDELLQEHGLATFRDTTPEAVELTRALLRQCLRDFRAADARSIVVLVPDGRTLTSNFPLSGEELASMAVGLVDGREFLGSSDYYPRDSHWRASGHRKVAERLAALLEAQRP